MYKQRLQISLVPVRQIVYSYHTKHQRRTQYLPGMKLWENLTP